MKIYSTVFLLFFLFATIPTLAQNINIQDANFKNALVSTLCADNNGDNQFETDVDTNNDGEIQENEALYVKSLKVDNQQIASLAGIEYFKNLGELNVAYNNLTTLELYDFPYLYNLFAPYNQLSTLRFLAANHGCKPYRQRAHPEQQSAGIYL